MSGILVAFCSFKTQVQFTLDVLRVHMQLFFLSSFPLFNVTVL